MLYSGTTLIVSMLIESCRMKWAVSLNNRIKRVAPCHTLKNPTKCLWRWEPDRRSNCLLQSACTFMWNIVDCDFKQPIHLNSTRIWEQNTVSHPQILSIFASLQPKRFDWSIFLSLMESWKLIPLKWYVLCIGILLCWHANDVMFWAYLRTQQNYASAPSSKAKHGPLSTLPFPGLILTFTGIVRYWVESCLPTIFSQIIILYYDLYMSSVEHVSCKHTLNHLLSRIRKHQYALTTERTSNQRLNIYCGYKYIHAFYN